MQNMQNDFEGLYKMKIKKEDEWYLAKIVCPDKSVIWTQGRTKEEILEMMADAVMCSYEIEVNWWNKFLCRLMYFGK